MRVLDEYQSELNVDIVYLDSIKKSDIEYINVK